MVVSMDDASFPMAAIGKSYLNDIEINPDISKRQFSDIEVKVDPDAAFRDETFWDAHRIDSLTERVKATYILVDSLTQGTDIFDRVLGVTEKLMTESALPIGWFNLDIDHIINVHKAQLHIHLGEFRLAVSTQVFITEAARELEIAVISCHHQQLLVELRGLGKSEEGSRIDPAWHQVITGSLRRALSKHGSLDLQEAFLCHEFS